MIVQIPAQTMTNEAFFEIVNRPENADKRFELIDRVIYEMPAPTVLHQWIVSQLMFVLMLFTREKPLGRVFGDNTDFVLTPGYVVQPDVSFVVAERVDLGLARFEGSPDIAVEVLSPSNSLYGTNVKIEAYLRYGSRMVITISPEDRVVRVYRPTPDGYHVKILNRDDALTGGDVLPGFNVPVRDLFPPEPAEEKAEPHD